MLTPILTEIQLLRKILLATILHYRAEITATPGYDQEAVDALTAWYWRIAAAGEREQLEVAS